MTDVEEEWLTVLVDVFCGPNRTNVLFTKHKVKRKMGRGWVEGMRMREGARRTWQGGGSLMRGGSKSR